MEPMSLQNKLKSSLFSALFAEITVINIQCTNNKETKDFFWFLFNKPSFFLHGLFLKSKAQISKNNYRMMFFMSKQVCLPKISSILQEITGAKSNLCPFCTKAFNYFKSCWLISPFFKKPIFIERDQYMMVHVFGSTIAIILLKLH